MAKHRRWSDKPKNDSVDKTEEPLVEEPLVEEPTTTSLNFKSILQSCSKYVYIIAAAALVSGIFTPLTIDAEITTVVYGILTILLGLGGGILIFQGIKNQKLRSIMVCGGLGMMIISLILIYELADRSIIQ